MVLTDCQLIIESPRHGLACNWKGKIQLYNLIKIGADWNSLGLGEFSLIRSNTSINLIK